MAAGATPPNPPRGELIFIRFAMKWAPWWADCNWLSFGSYVRINERLITAMQARARSQRDEALANKAVANINLLTQAIGAERAGRPAKVRFWLWRPFYFLETQRSWSFSAGLQEINVSFQTHSQMKRRKQTGWSRRRKQEHVVERWSSCKLLHINLLTQAIGAERAGRPEKVRFWLWHPFIPWRHK